MKKECPIERTIKTLSLKWNMLILKHLNESIKPKRFNQLMLELKPISSRTLSKRLKDLELDGLIYKIKYNEVPPRVDYSLTDSGKEIIKTLKPLIKWNEKFGNKNIKNK